MREANNATIIVYSHKVGQQAAQEWQAWHETNVSEMLSGLVTNAHYE